MTRAANDPLAAVCEEARAATATAEKARVDALGCTLDTNNRMEMLAAGMLPDFGVRSPAVRPVTGGQYSAQPDRPVVLQFPASRARRGDDQR